MQPPVRAVTFGLAVRWHTPVLAGTTILDIDTERGRNGCHAVRAQQVSRRQSSIRKSDAWSRFPSGDLHERELLSASTVATMALGILEYVLPVPVDDRDRPTLHRGRSANDIGIPVELVFSSNLSSRPNIDLDKFT